MRILALSDRVVPFIDSINVKDSFPDVDLILGCGDLPSRYLELVLTVLNVPCVFVPGNHDRNNIKVPGARNADGRLLEVLGLRILGLGGSPRYKSKGRHQYTERQMNRRTWPYLPGFYLNHLRGRRSVDIILTHAPPKGIHDANDPAHVGFRVFLKLMELARPRLLAHGHTHVHPNLEITETEFEDTLVVNVYPYKIIDLSQEGTPRVG